MIGMEVEINVTAEDIKCGEAGNCILCPVALAVKRHVKEECDVIVGINMMEILDRRGKRQTIIQLPTFVSAFIKCFDVAADKIAERIVWSPTPPEPFTFKIALPPECIKPQ